MARPVEFDRDLALREAMLLFWRRGYGKTSVRDITDATRLQPGSLYGAFGNKRALFRKTLDLYSTDTEHLISEVLRSNAPPLDRIEHFFDRILGDTARKGRKGCLLVNTLLEMQPDDEDLGRHAAMVLKKVEDALAEVLNEAAANGDLAPDKEPVAEAGLLMTGILGLRLYYRMRPDQQALRRVAEVLLAALRG